MSFRDKKWSSNTLVASAQYQVLDVHCATDVLSPCVSADNEYT